VSLNAFFSSRSEKKNIFFDLDIKVKNQSKCSLVWCALLLTTIRVIRVVKICGKNYDIKERLSLYLPTQIRFPIGERVTCHGSKLTNSLAWTTLTTSLEKQQLELSTRTWSGRTPLNGGKFVCTRPDVKSWSRATFLTREGIHYSRKGIYNSAKTYQINKGENLNILCLRAFNLAPKLVVRVRQLAIRSLSPLAR